jgi:hypothetical protein
MASAANGIQGFRLFAKRPEGRYAASGGPNRSKERGHAPFSKALGRRCDEKFSHVVQVKSVAADFGRPIMSGLHVEEPPTLHLSRLKTRTPFVKRAM